MRINRVKMANEKLKESEAVIEMFIAYSMILLA